MEHLETMHRFNYQGRVWKISLYEGKAKLISRKPPFKWDYEWNFSTTNKTPSYAMRVIRHCWTQMKDKPQPKFSE